MQAALFLGSLTSFIIEGYKLMSLQPEDAHLLVLMRLSQQIAAQTTGDKVLPINSMDDLPTFKPTKASIFTNYAWFASLFTTLACALLATLSRQWIREYQKEVESCNTDTEKARVRYDD